MFHCIVMAAGQSHRFGTNKLLQSVQGLPLYCHLFQRLQQLQQAQPEVFDVTVVSRFPEIQEASSAARFHYVLNDAPAAGLSRTIELGIRAQLGKLGEIPPLSAAQTQQGLASRQVSLERRSQARSTGWIFFTADQPYVSLNSLQRFFERCQYSPADLITVASEARLGNPCYFSLHFTEELLKLSGDQGGRLVMQAHPELCCEQVLVPDWELDDVDRPSDLQA